MIIVTGGAGFIGSNLIHGLNSSLSLDDILVVDNLERGDKHRNLNRLRFADYMDKAELLGALPSLGAVEAVFHQGACSSTTESDGRYMMENNYQYSKALLHFCMEKRIPFIYASSAAVYGDGSAGFGEQPQAEYPLNVYGYSKFAFDNYVRRHRGQVQSPVIGLRYFNVYGPQEVHKGRMASVAYHLHQQLSRGEPMRLFEGSEDFKRDFVFVGDVVHVNLHFLEHGGQGIFNCGSGEARSFMDIARALQVRAGRGTIEAIPFPADLKGKYQRFTQADLHRLREAGCTVSFRSLEEGIDAYAALLDSHSGYLA